MHLREFTLALFAFVQASVIPVGVKQRGPLLHCFDSGVGGEGEAGENSLLASKHR